MKELTTHEVADLLGVSQQTVRNGADAGLLAMHRTPGGHRRFREDDVLAYRDARLLGEAGTANGRVAAWAAAAEQLLRAAERDLGRTPTGAVFRSLREEMIRRLRDA